MDTLNSEDESLEYIKDILTHLNPIIKMSGNSEATKELLPHLSELDPLFHQLKLVKGLRNNLRDSLSAELEEAIEKYLLENKGKTRTEPPVEHLVKLIFTSKSLKELAAKYNKDMDKGIGYIYNIGEDAFFDEILENDVLNIKESPVNSSEHSLNSSLNQSGFLFLHPAQYNIIAENLHRKDSMEGLHDALNMLLMVTPGEPVSQEPWPLIKKNLKKLLLHNDDAIFSKVIRIHTRLLASQVHSVVVEGYFNLLEAIASFWLSRKQFKNLPDASQGIILQNNKLIILISIILKFMKEFSLVWVRYPSKYMSEVIDQTFSLFVTSILPGKLSVFNILSIIDPKASWLHCWMHGRLGRQKVCEALSSKLSLVFSLLSDCISYLENNDSQKQERPSKNRFSSNEINFLIFSHSFHFVIKILHHVDGVSLFPIVDPITQQHISIKKFMKTLEIPFTNGNRTLVCTILSQLTESCFHNESICRLICDSGFANFLVSTIPYSDIAQDNIWYHEIVLDFFCSLNNTTIGHKYILLGTLQRISLATLITSNDGAIGRSLCAMAENLLKSRVSQSLSEKSVSLCLQILCSPLGKYLYFKHSMMPAVVDTLKSNSEKGEGFETSQILDDHTFFIILKALLHCYEGIIYLDKNLLLESVLNHLLPQFADRCQIKIRLLNTVTSSQKGAKLLADLSAIKPFWEMVNIMITNEVTCKVISLEDDKEQLFAKAILPLLCLTSSYEGTVQLFGENGIMNAINNFFSEESREGDVKKIIFYLLCSSVSSLDKMIYMQKTFDVEKKLSDIESNNFDEEMAISYVDEYSVMANHIISSCLLPRGLKSNQFPIFPELNTDPFEMKDESSLYTSHGNTTRSKDIWKFLSDSENRTQDTSSITHCRRTYRLEIAANSLFKASTFLDIIDFTIGNLMNSPDELLPGKLLANCRSLRVSDDCDQCRRKENESEEKLENLTNISNVKSCNCSANKFSVGLMFRYAVELKLLPDNNTQKSNMTKLSRSVHENLLANNYTKTDWLSLLFYIMSGGCMERTWNIFEGLRSLRVGVIIWPALYPSLAKERPPHAMLYAGVIQAVKLLLYRDAPNVYIAYEIIRYL